MCVCGFAFWWCSNGMVRWWCGGGGGGSTSNHSLRLHFSGWAVSAGWVQMQTWMKLCLRFLVTLKWRQHCIKLIQGAVLYRTNNGNAALYKTKDAALYKIQDAALYKTNTGCSIVLYKIQDAALYKIQFWIHALRLRQRASSSSVWCSTSGLTLTDTFQCMLGYFGVSIILRIPPWTTGSLRCTWRWSFCMCICIHTHTRDLSL